MKLSGFKSGSFQSKAEVTLESHKAKLQKWLCLLPGLLAHILMRYQGMGKSCTPERPCVHTMVGNPRHLQSLMARNHLFSASSMPSPNSQSTKFARIMTLLLYAYKSCDTLLHSQSNFNDFL